MDGSYKHTSRPDSRQFGMWVIGRGFIFSNRFLDHSGTCDLVNSFIERAFYTYYALGNDSAIRETLKNIQNFYARVRLATLLNGLDLSFR